MKKTIIHLSDLHFRLNWEEDQGLVLEAFFRDLARQVEALDKSNVYIAFSGDVVLAGGRAELYEKFTNQFDDELNRIGIPISQRICIPGNHDVSVDFIKENFEEHEAIISLALNERAFNDYIQKKPKLLFEKFNNYINFESSFSSIGLKDGSLTGTGWDLDSNTGVFCLNTAICSSGGANHTNDQGRLAIDTRTLNKWLLECKAPVKILIMHHPLNWLTEWANSELSKLIKNNFSLCLSGHVHEQSYFHSINKDLKIINCSAPPLLTNKKDNLGYAMISVSDKGVLNIKYRQWTKNNSFVTGVNFSDTDDGKIIIQEDEEYESKKKELINQINLDNNFITRYLSNRLNDSLRSFSSQPIIWVEPMLSSNTPHSNNANNEENIYISDFISDVKSTIIKAPPQFGLTCLAHYMIKEAWINKSDIWIYIDAKTTEWHSTQKNIDKELSIIGHPSTDIKCIVLDSWSGRDKEEIKLLNKLSNNHKDTPIIIMNTIDESQFMENTDDVKLERKFNTLHLLALPRERVRGVVSAYNNEMHIGEEDIVLSKIISDLEVLNLHRTPFNCLTLLKVSEKYFDESPINRADMINKILTLLFNTEKVPRYKEKPDLKDCEYVLGKFCSKLVKTQIFSFTRDEFIRELKLYCKEIKIELDIDVVFDVLHNNNIIIKRGIFYYFRFSYWIYYFAAHRMHDDHDFAEYILKDKRYTNFPEIIEFYTGIDRSRTDALEIMLTDLSNTRAIANNKIGISEEFNPLRFLSWKPKKESIIKMNEEISENVLDSNLPETVKDKYADKDYDQTRPYDQSVRNILQEYSVVFLMQSIIAASRALRNSDYANPETKTKLFQEILKGWEQITQTLLVLTPILAAKGYSSFEGANFILAGSFSNKDFSRKIISILQSIPHNVVNWYKNDLFSNKMAPLIFESLINEENEYIKLTKALLLIYTRPRNWHIQIQNYISHVSKNSFYLLSIFIALKNQYKYAFVSSRTLNEIVYLIKMCLAKHELGTKSPGKETIKKIPETVLPKREVD